MSGEGSVRKCQEVSESCQEEVASKLPGVIRVAVTVVVRGVMMEVDMVVVMVVAISPGHLLNPSFSPPT